MLTSIVKLPGALAIPADKVAALLQHTAVSCIGRLPKLVASLSCLIQAQDVITDTIVDCVRRCVACQDVWPEDVKPLLQMPEGHLISKQVVWELLPDAVRAGGKFAGIACALAR